MKSVFWGLGKKSGKNGRNAEKIGSCRKKVELFGTLHLPDIIVIKI